jgi:SET domain-containing protein
VYRLVARFNHSCRANGAYHFRPGGAAVAVRSVVDIAAGEEVCIAYIDVLQPLPRCA